MLKNHILFIFPFLLIELHANENLLEKYHDNVCQWLVNTSNSIDDYFIDSNTSLSSKTYAEFKTSFAVESDRKSEYAMKLKLRLNLPKIQKKLRLIFEDEDSDNIFYDDTALNSNYHLEKKSYFLKVDYFNTIINKFNLTAGAGVKFRKKSLQPYLNLKGKYIFEDSIDIQSLVSNRTRFYVNGDIENVTSYSSLKYIDEKNYIFFNNSFGYKSYEEYQKIVNGLSLVHPYDHDNYLTVGVSILSELMDSDLNLIYPQLYGTYRDKLYKDWIYYELNPSILLRQENDYATSIRFMLNIGTVFKTD